MLGNQLVDIVGRHLKAQVDLIVEETVKEAQEKVQHAIRREAAIHAIKISTWVSVMEHGDVIRIEVKLPERQDKGADTCERYDDELRHKQ